MTRSLLLYAATVPVYVLIDFLWLGFVAKDFYRGQIGQLLTEPFVWWAAVLFYVLFVAGVLLFAVRPALHSGGWTKALLLGAAFGFFTYMTYNLTNLATLRDWPVTLVVVDILWGTVLAASVATTSYVIGSRIFA